MGKPSSWVVVTRVNSRGYYEGSFAGLTEFAILMTYVLEQLDGGESTVSPSFNATGVPLNWPPAGMNYNLEADLS